MYTCMHKPICCVSDDDIVECEISSGVLTITINNKFRPFLWYNNLNEIKSKYGTSIYILSCFVIYEMRSNLIVCAFPIDRQQGQQSNLINLKFEMCVRVSSSHVGFVDALHVIHRENL